MSYTQFPVAADPFPAFGSDNVPSSGLDSADGSAFSPRYVERHPSAPSASPRDVPPPTTTATRRESCPIPASQCGGNPGLGLEAPDVRKLGYPYAGSQHLVQVRNTFIEVQESSDVGNPQYLSLPSRKRGHLRCASEPMASFSFLGCGPELVTMTSRLEGGELNDQREIGSRLQAAMGEAMGGTTAAGGDGDKGADVSGGSSPSPSPSSSARRHGHLRQVSMISLQTVDTIDEEHAHLDQELHDADLPCCTVRGDHLQTDSSKSCSMARLAGPGQADTPAAPLATDFANIASVSSSSLPWEAPTPSSSSSAAHFNCPAATSLQGLSAMQQAPSPAPQAAAAWLGGGLPLAGGARRPLPRHPLSAAPQLAMCLGLPPVLSGPVPAGGLAQPLAPGIIKPAVAPGFSCSSPNDGAENPGAWPPGSGLAGQQAAWYQGYPGAPLAWRGYASEPSSLLCGHHVAPSPADAAIALAAYAQGFSAGAAASSVRAAAVEGKRSVRQSISIGSALSFKPASGAEQAYPDPSSKTGPAGSHSRNGVATAAKGGQKPLVCKWFARGTCKFGASCRFSHQDLPKSDGNEAARLDATAPAPEAAAPTPPRKATVDAAKAAQGHGSFTTPPPRPKPKAVAYSPPTPPEPVTTALGQSREGRQRMEAPRASTADGGDEDLASSDSDGGCDKRRFYCQVVWCDQRAFKEVHGELKTQLEAATQMPVKAHKTAEKCMRLLQKKKRAAVERCQAISPSVFLVSWANAPTLVPYLCEVSQESTKVVVLCDLCGVKGCDSASRWSRHFPLVESIAVSRDQAVEMVAKAVVALQLSAASKS